eukprot:4231604-Amphidinium_carterae.1
MEGAVSKCNEWRCMWHNKLPCSCPCQQSDLLLGDVGYPPAGQPDASSLSSIDDLPFQKGEMVFFGEGFVGAASHL